MQTNEQPYQSYMKEDNPSETSAYVVGIKVQILLNISFVGLVYVQLNKRCGTIRDCMEMFI